jgi:hypothetical protein
MNVDYFKHNFNNDYNTIFTWIKMTPQKNKSAKGKFSYPNLRRSSRNKTSAKKNILLLMACQILSTFTNQCHCLHLHSQSFFQLSHTISISPFSSLPLHNISSVPSILLDIQDILKPFVFTSSKTSCHAVMIHTDWILHLYTFINLLEPMKKIQFSPQIVLVVLRILNTCSGLTYCVCGLIRVSSWFFL